MKAMTRVAKQVAQAVKKAADEIAAEDAKTSAALAKTAAYQSNLSDSHAGYDLVIAVSQKSLNATLKAFLDKHVKLPTFTRAFIFNKNFKPNSSSPKAVEIDFERLKKDVGFDPFSIPNGTPVSDPRVQKLLTEQKFMYAYQTEMGLPDFDLKLIPDTISFKGDGHSTVSYSMTNKTFKIIKLDPSFFTGGEWKVISQDDSERPWTFEFIVNLDLRTGGDVLTRFQQLPADAQKQIKALGQNMFGVDQLYLDLNSAKLAGSPKIKGLDEKSEAYVFTRGVFINGYFEQLAKGSGNGVLLGYTVKKRKDAKKDAASIIPTDMNFSISAHKDSKGKSTKDYSLYTLNYLVMCGGRKHPKPTSFPWNWISQPELKDYHGAMAVKRDVIVEYLKTLLSPSLKKVSFVPEATINIKNPWSMKYKWSVKPETANQSYTKVDSKGGSHVLTYKYHKRSSDKDTFVPLWGNISLTTETTSNIYLEGSIIRSVNKIWAKAHINIEGGVSSGTWARYESEASYRVAVDARGGISVTPIAVNVSDTSEKIKANGWSSFVSSGTVGNLLKKIKGSMQGIQKFLVGYEKHIQNRLNGPKSWVFPGGKTFAFKDVFFSKHQDLVAHVLYADKNY